MVGFNLHVYRDHAVLSLDSSWDSLHKRGYRPIQTIAPLNEALAAGLLLQSGWDATTPLVDPLCGSGTFCIEAAWIALDRPPGLTRKWFGVSGLDRLRPAALDRPPRRRPPRRPQGAARADRRQRRSPRRDRSRPRQRQRRRRRPPGRVPTPRRARRRDRRRVPDRAW